MFNIGWSELLLIAVVAIIVVGPKELPRLMRTFGHYAGKLRRAAADFQRQFEDAMQESELDEMRKALDDVRTTAASMHTSTSLDRPLMLPEPASPRMQETAASAPAKPKPAPRKTLKTATLKNAPRTGAARKAPRKVTKKVAARKEPKP
jgi:sec-independent protein translocase protein TatB